MNPYSPIAQKFISAVRRRVLVIRIAESIAIATAIASAAGLVLMPILWLSGKSGFELSVAMLALGTIIGLIWGIARRPSLLQAAMEADRQLALDDLLGTILLLNRQPTHNDWASAISAVAESRCQKLHPSAVVVARLGGRAWGGVGIAAALLISAGLLTSHPMNVNAASSTPGLTADQSQQNSNNSSPAALSNSNQSPAARPPGPGGTDESSIRPFTQDQPDLSNQSRGTVANNINSYSQTTPGAGSGAAVTQTPMRQPQPAPLASSNRNQSNPAGTPASGTGPANPNANLAGQSDSAIASSSTRIIHQPAPWNSDQWPQNIAAARDAINSGQVPESDADLVRDYFQPN